MSTCRLPKVSAVEYVKGATSLWEFVNKNDDAAALFSMGVVHAKTKLYGAESNNY